LTALVAVAEAVVVAVPVAMGDEGRKKGRNSSRRGGENERRIS
jgi:hypothetical protein